MVIASYAPSYSQRTPYLTVKEFKNAPTGLDLSELVQGSGYSQDTAVSDLIGRASSIIDSYCFGESGTLCATINTEATRTFANRQGEYNIHPKFWPILEVTAFAVGSSPGQLAATTLSSSNCWIQEQMFTIVGGGGSMSSQGSLGFGNAGRPGQKVFCQYSYVNGWANTLLSASVSAGGSSASVTVTNGIYPNMPIGIYDAPFNEALTVASTYVPGTNPVQFSAPFANNHVAGVSITALPPAIKHAAILITGALVKERGGGAIVLAESGEGSTSSKETFGRGDDLEFAAELLDPYRTTVVM